MKVKRERLLPLLSDAIFPLLLAVAGGILVNESRRITAKYKPANWLAGPSGLMMIVGVLLLFLTLVEVFFLIRRNLKSRVATEVVPSVAKEVEVEESEVSDRITADTIMNYETAEEEQSAEERRISKYRMLISLGLLGLYTFLVKPLGFILASTIYTLINLFVLRNSWKSTFITTVIIFALLYFGAPAMSLSLPRGIFGF